ncbi:MAG: hypothetical protein LUH15_19365 [Tannerellaceae bacterium]|nr:hypothetical protein [Tannerellaceae bacterium]
MKKQRINILQFLTALLLGLVSVSCQQDDWGEKNNASNPDGFILNYEISNNRTDTKASVEYEEGEDLIYSLYVLFFEYSVHASGKYIATIDLSPEDGLPMADIGTKN